jgi:hypothetical protein
MGRKGKAMDARGQDLSNTVEAILLVGEPLTEEVYEKYVSGEITRNTLNEVYAALSEWTSKSKQLLEMILQMPG